MIINSFTIKSVTENLGGIGTVSFSLEGFVKSGESVGDFNAANSTGRIVASKNFPIFEPRLRKLVSLKVKL